MKALTEMKRKHPALVFRYSFPPKLNFSVNTNDSKAASFQKIKRKLAPSPSQDVAKTTQSCSFSTSSDSMTVLKLTNGCTKQMATTPCEVSRLPKCQKGAKMKDALKKLSKARKNVSFQDSNEIWGILSRHDISAEERHEIWYSREEYEEIIRACSKQISMLERGKPLKDRKFCARGLESNTQLQAGTKSMNRCLAYQAVLGEQERQIRAGFDTLDDREIAQLYNATSYSCQLWAQVVGLADQREAQDIQDEELFKEQSSEEFYRGRGGGPEEQSFASDGANEEGQVLQIPEQLAARAA